MTITTSAVGEFTATIEFSFLGPQSNIIDTQSAEIRVIIKACTSVAKDSKSEKTVEYTLGQGALIETVRKKNASCPNSEFILPDFTETVLPKYLTITESDDEEILTIDDTNIIKTGLDGETFELEIIELDRVTNFKAITQITV